MMDFVFDTVENIVGKGENASYPQCFQLTSFSGLLKGLTHSPKAEIMAC